MSDSKKSASNKPGKKENLHTDLPLSEKDEVKQAEHKTAKVQKSTKNTSAAEPKNLKHGKE